MTDDTYGPKSYPTGKLAAVRPPTPLVRVSDSDDEPEEETRVICPTCAGHGTVSTEEYARWRLTKPAEPEPMAVPEGLTLEVPEADE